MGIIVNALCQHMDLCGLVGFSGQGDHAAVGIRDALDQQALSSVARALRAQYVDQIEPTVVKLDSSGLFKKFRCQKAFRIKLYTDYSQTGVDGSPAIQHFEHRPCPRAKAIIDDQRSAGTQHM
jgi:hypothetical protein